MAGTATCSAGAPCLRWIWHRSLAQSKISGWQHDPKALGWDGFRCSIRRSWRRCCRCPAMPSRWRSCALVRCRTFPTGPHWSWTAGRWGVRSPNSSRRIAGDKHPQLRPERRRPPRLKSRSAAPRPSGGYDAGVQPPPPGLPPQGGPPPDDPREPAGPGFGGQPGPESYGQQPPPAGYGPPPGSGFPPPAEYGQQPAAPAPTSQQTISWVSLAAIGLMGLLGAILTLTLWINLNSAVSRAADVCNRFGGEYSSMCREQIKNMVPTVPVALVVCLFLIIAACLAATAGAVMLFVKRPMGLFPILGGGIVMLILSIGCEARYGATSRVTYDLIAGLVIAVIGGLMFVPGFGVFWGWPRRLPDVHRPGGFPGGGQWPPPPQYGPPGPPQQW